VLCECDSVIQGYRKGEIPKARAYTEIQSKLFKAVGDEPAKAESAFGSFIATIENYDTQVLVAGERGLRVAGKRAQPPSRSVTPDGGSVHSEDEFEVKKLKVDESKFPWVVANESQKGVMSANLTETLKLLESYSIDLKATKRSLTNSPFCPEFPDAEWKNVVAGRAVNLDAVLSGQFSTSNNDVRVEKIGDLEVSFGAVEPTKSVTNGGDWSIAWNRAVRATAFAFPHREVELTGYGEYITSLFAATNPSFHNRIIAFDKAVRRRVGAVRNLELSQYDRFADLKIARIDSIGVSIGGTSSGRSGSSRSKTQKGKGAKLSEPCNRWNEGLCVKAEEECRRQHVCNRCSKSGHKGKDCRKPSA
jgi:hypothetical protein